MSARSLSKEQCEEVLSALALHGTQAAAARALGVPVTTYKSRVEIAQRGLNGAIIRLPQHEARITTHIDSGCVIVFADAHYFPGPKSTAHRALIQAIKEFRPRGVIGNGDLFDGASISRHPRIGWDSAPTVKEELEVVTERLDEVEQATRNYAWLAWTLGNHDSRYETYLAANAPQYQHVSGFSLKDHFPLWKPAWRCDINPGEDSHTIVKHKWKGGMGASRANALNSGVNFVSAHFHSPKVSPITDARGTRYGVDPGCLADVNSEAFVNYTEDGIKDWRSGFALLTFKSGRLLMPELVSVVSEEAGIVEFRGKEYHV